jgi:DMATS type aromatic prenyltransferase
LDAQHWWNSSGYALSILFDKAGYSSSSQYDLLCFFQSLTRFLGPARVDGKNTWNSFMTDDHNPIELSWDWRTGGKPPKIRLSIEPVGRYAGTERDPNNSKAAKDFRRRLPELVPSTNMAWLAHFQRQLSVGEETVDAATGHSSKEFYAFDLDENGSIISKAYLFPAYKAGVTGLSSLDIVSEAIKSAPESTLDKIQALAIFRDFASDPQLSSLEIELLAIDLVQPAESRFKIYFRIRDTSFASFRHVMTLGNRIVDSPEQGRGLADMEQLYKTLFIPSEFESQWDEHMQLPATNHRTGGFLYFAEFKYGSKWPKVKAYLPVRHYSSSEEATFSALGHYLRGNMFLKDYIAAMRTVL